MVFSISNHGLKVVHTGTEHISLSVYPLMLTLGMGTVTVLGHMYGPVNMVTAAIPYSS